jgi:tetratricopeptide (TPR) repeat protein
LAFAADKPWIEIRSQHFRVLTDGSEKDARKVARDLEQMHEVFAYRYPSFHLDSGPPLLVFAPRDNESADSLDHSFGSEKGQTGLLGVYHEGWEKQYAAFRLTKAESIGRPDDSSSMNVIYHEYVHSIMHRNTRWLPVWLDEGFAEFMGSTHFEGNTAIVGYPSERVHHIKEIPLIPIDTLLKVDSSSPYYHDSRLASTFYAESWLTVHYMELGTGMEDGKKLEAFYGLIDQGTDQQKAFAQVFGDPKKFHQALIFYIQAPTLKNWVLRDLPRVDENQFTVRTLSAAEGEAEVAGYHVWMHDYQDARPIAEQALQDDPKLALAHENMGFVDFGDGKDADAAKEFSAAFDLDPKRYLSLYYKTMLEASQGKTFDEDAIYSGCLRVLQINPQFAEAYVQLSFHQLRLGNLSNALLMAKKAAALEPSRAGYNLLVAHILRVMGQNQDAAQIASFVATRWTGPDHDEAVEIWDSIPQSQRPLIDNPTDEIPKDTKTMAGTVDSITCADNDKNIKFDLVLNHDGQTSHFHSDGGFASGYSDTIWYGRDHFNLCHHLESMRTIVRYKPAKDATYAGDVAELEFRVDVPTPPPQQPVTAQGK